MSGDVSWWGLAASLLLVGVAIAISLRERLRLERDMLVAVARSLAQLLLVGAALGLIVDEGTWIGWSFVWVAGMVTFAAVTVARRAPALPAVLPIAATAIGSSAALGLGLLFVLQVFPVEGRTVVPLAGMVVGNALSATVVTVRRTVDAFAERRADLEARLALGLPSTEAARPTVRNVLRLAIAPDVERIKALGIVVLPGAMTGLILAGVDPLDAVRVQLALMYVILGAVATSTTITALLGTRRLFTPDHRLVVLRRSAADEG
ncbi:MAG: ABC transporter permease [Solirubrobacterales bacterium]|nr:ABC transporter permease [Solirubrobacterales bacterium]